MNEAVEFDDPKVVIFFQLLKDLIDCTRLSCTRVSVQYTRTAFSFDYGVFENVLDPIAADCWIREKPDKELTSMSLQLVRFVADRAEFVSVESL